MASELMGIVAAFIVILVQCTGALAENEFFISWKGVVVNGLSLDSYLDPNVYNTNNTNNNCLNFSICNNVDNYPTELARWALEELRKKYNAVRYTLEKSETTDSKIMQLCPSQGEIMFPTAALSKDDRKWYFILNLPNYNFQGFYVNKCVNIPSPCYGVSGESTCEQGYTERSMIYLDLKKQIVSKKTFKVPSCCYCAVNFETL